MCVNADDPAGIARRTFGFPLLTYGMVVEADVTPAKLLERHGSEQTFMLFAGNDAIPVRTHHDW
ncbi:MAG: hypothetical protein U0894_06220 [Pirellulales bacterium]